MPNERDLICYKKNFLTAVIARIDFPLPLKQVSKGLPKELLDMIKPIFPIFEPRQTISREMQISNSQLKQRNVEQGMEWHFHGEQKEKTLTIAPNTLFVNYKQYHTYENLKEEFLQVALEFLNHFKGTQVSRLGIRAVNEIKLDEPNPLDWSNYINPLLLNTFSFGEQTDNLSRAFNNLEYSFGEFNLRFQFGMHNPDYPAKIVKKVFILDLDAYYQGLLERDDLAEYCDGFHEKLQSFFEESITQNLREIMNA